jgi:hypothetical protein
VPLNWIPDDTGFDFNEAGKLNKHCAVVGCVIARAIPDLSKANQRKGWRNKLSAKTYPALDTDSVTSLNSA